MIAFGIKLAPKRRFLFAAPPQIAQSLPFFAATSTWMALRTCRNVSFLAIYTFKRSFYPRQARDKHRKNTQKHTAFHARRGVRKHS
jgi:hypothetical protein